MIPQATKNFIGGQLTNGQQTTLSVISPVNGQVLSEVVLSTKTDLDQAVLKAQEAFTSWSKKP